MFLLKLTELRMFFKMNKESNVHKMLKFLPEVMKSLLWKAVMMFQWFTRN